jgi:hypothetical protein
MLNDNDKQAVINCVSLWDWMNGSCGGRRLPTDKELDSYFINNYGGNNLVLCIYGTNGGVLTYEPKSDMIYIRDFWAFGDGFGMFNDILKISGDRIIVCNVAATNIRLLNVCLRCLGFRITEYKDEVYTLERG